MSHTVITKHLMERMRRYLDYLKCLTPDGAVNITAEQIADAVGVHAAVVRQDLSIISNGELPDVGYIIEYLIADLEHHLGYDKNNSAVLVGAG